MRVRLEEELDTVGAAGETTVSQRASPAGRSVFLMKPSFSV